LGAFDLVTHLVLVLGLHVWIVRQAATAASAELTHPTSLRLPERQPI
jgi:hypothetical protein